MNQGLVSRLLERLGAVLLVAAAAQAPAFFGSATPGAVNWLLLLTGGSLILAPRPRRPASRHAAIVVIIGYVLWLAVAAFQLLVPASPALSIPLMQDAAGLVGVERVLPSLTLNPSRFVDALARASLVAMALLAAILHGQNRNVALRSLYWIVGLAAVLALASLAFFIRDPSLVLWHEKTVYVRQFTGTFINRGAAGAWHALMAATALVLLLRVVAKAVADLEGAEGSLLGDLLRSTMAYPVRTLLLGVSFGMLAIGLLLGQSRAASLVFLVQLAVVAAMLVAAGRSTWKFRAALLVGIALAGLGLLEVAGSGLGDRLTRDGVSDPGRLEIWKSTLAAITERPWIGYGPGTYPDLFPLFRTDALASFGQLRSAHNLPLELGAEAGLPLTLLLASCWLLLGALLLRKGGTGSGFDAIRLCGLLAWFALSALVCVDVVSQTFGFVLPALVITGLALGQVGRTGARDARRDEDIEDLTDEPSETAR